MLPATKASFTKALEGLIKKFEADQDTYLTSGYGEAQARTHFITPFFKALGWDVENEAGVPYHLCEVWEEKGETEGRPDYTFRLNGQTKFFIEAKAPSVSLGSPGPILQTKSYAWNSKDVLLAGLTHFEEFRFFDASLEPDERRVLDGEAFHLQWTEYLEKVDLLWELSPERVLQGSLDQFLRRDRKSIRYRVPVDERFLDELTEWRHELASNIHRLNSTVDATQLNDIVQRLLDRIVFLRIAEERKVIESGQLRELVELWEQRAGKVPIMQDLVNLFSEINDDFNGEIFKPHPCEKVKIDSSLLAKIIRRLYPPRSPYRFDVIGVELLGSIYERYLGNTLNVTAKQVRLEPKPEVRKAGGVYYTPKFIVDYIVRNTIGNLVNGKTPKEVERVRILDPACGSGSFLIGAFQFLIDWHLAYYHEHPNEAHLHPMYPEIVKDPDGSDRLSFHAKIRIMRQNLYGVDIDQQAVEITMMSLYLKALEAEKGMLAPKKEVLPELKYNIRCGNSLIGPDIQKESSLTPDDNARMRPFDWHSREDGFGDILASGGFQCVIGNPPWGQKAVPFSEVEKDYFSKHYQVGRGILDLFKLFVERALSLVRKEGFWGMILPDIVLLKDYPETRKLILETTEIKSIAYAGMAFRRVNIDSVCIVCQKTPSSQATKAKVRLIRDLTPQVAHATETGNTPYIAQSVFWKLDGLKFNIHLDEPKLALLKKLQRFPRFEEAFEAHEGIHSGNIRAKLFLPKKKNRNCRPLIFGRDEIDRFYLHWNGMWVDYDQDIIDREHGEYANLSSPDFFEPPKIFIRRTGDYVMAASDDSGYYASNNLFVLLPKQGHNSWDLHLVCGLLNSRLMTWFFRTIQPRVGKLFAELKINQIHQFPLPFPGQRQTEASIRTTAGRIGALAKQMVTLNDKGHSHNLDSSKTNTVEDKTAVITNEIDNLVYKLYDISDTERRLIEEVQ